MADEKLDPRVDDYDWKQIFEGSDNGAPYTKPTHVRTKEESPEPYSRAQIAKIIAVDDGEADERNWVGVFKMTDGKFLTVRAGCDYTGWDCQASGNSDLADTLEDAIAFGLTEGERDRLRDQLEQAGQ